MENPRIPSAALHNMPDCYKIKLRKIGYRLVYRVDDNVITVTVIAIGKRDKSVVYDVANSRL
ncbi:mRNA interferase RelE [Kingella kingae]|uniref:type II toxin-antitoxin system RelE family toxin n=1 Tax=Kingella negevensis TaxID=1522312 RepID=UPI0002585079|nr:type II toxin-antitoxin system RelE/ParE family toxin [Kingella negevensis]EIC13812.1 RelE/StbE family addiction module toxin [Kingella kingae PYKK081]WII90759.1 type II toxin-antitoxin system RelE/ParE family toxin [Kingella negevensis]STR04097.1 mRNA interferase RelE [Kingella kingae]